MEPKLADPIVFNYEKSHLKLTAIRQTLTSSKAALTWREATVDEDPAHTCTYRLDPSGSRATDALFVTLNKPGLYKIASSVAVQLSSGTADVGIALDVQYPGQPITEKAYSESNVTDFDNVHVTISVRVLPFQVGTRSTYMAKPHWVPRLSGVGIRAQTPTKQEVNRVHSSILYMRVPRR